MKSIFILIAFFFSIKAQWIQLNLSTKQEEYLKAIDAAKDFIKQSPLYKSSIIHPAALYIVNQSYNQKFRVVLSVQNRKKIELYEIIIVTGKTTSGRYEITESSKYDDEIEMKITNKYFIRIQNEIEKYMKDSHINLKYIKKKLILKEFFIVYFNVREDGKIRSVVINVDMGNQLRLNGLFNI